MARPTAAYRLNPELHDLLGSGIIRLIVRGENVIGHYGRRGYVKGVLRGQELQAEVHDEAGEGRLDVTFDIEFSSFDGQLALVREQCEHVFPCSGMRVTRRR